MVTQDDGFVSFGGSVQAAGVLGGVRRLAGLDGLHGPDGSGWSDGSDRWGESDESDESDELGGLALSLGADLGTDLGTDLDADLNADVGTDVGTDGRRRRLSGMVEGAGWSTVESDAAPNAVFLTAPFAGGDVVTLRQAATVRLAALTPGATYVFELRAFDEQGAFGERQCTRAQRRTKDAQRCTETHRDAQT